MNLWTRFRLHLRRDKLRQRFMESEVLLYNLFQVELLANSKQEKRRWQHVEWLSEPILHIVPDSTAIPVALVGIAASYTLVDENEVNESESTSEPVVHTQAGTALFYFENDAWQTNGKVLLNVTPSQAFEQLERQATSLAPI